jgi:hypothetical protein
VFVMLSSGGDPLQLTKDEGNKAVRGFSSDGTEIYFARTLGDYEIWSIPTLGGAAKHLAAGVYVAPSLDGQFLSIEKTDGRIVRTPKSGSGEELIYTLPKSGILKSYPDGQHLLIVTNELGTAVSLLRLDLADRRLEKLADLPDISVSVAWAIPGKTLYVSRQVNGISNIWEYSLDDRSFRIEARCPIPMARDFTSSTARAPERSRSTGLPRSSSRTL